LLGHPNEFQSLQEIRAKIARKGDAHIFYKKNRHDLEVTVHVSLSKQHPMPILSIETSALHIQNWLMATSQKNFRP
jgi:hypothetical protein